MASKLRKKIEQLDLLKNNGLIRVAACVENLARIEQYVNDVHLQWHKNERLYTVEVSTDDMHICMEFSPPENDTITLEEYQAYLLEVAADALRKAAA